MSSESPVLGSLNIDLTKNHHLGLIYTEWNHAIVNKLLDQIKDALDQKKVSYDVVSVPGALELVYAAKKMALTQKYDAIITVGTVIRGDTYHFEYVCQGVAQGLSSLNADPNLQTPIIQGVLTVDTKKQAYDRIAAKKGTEIALSALHITKI